MQRFLLFVLSLDSPWGRAYFCLPRIGTAYPGFPPKVENLVGTKAKLRLVSKIANGYFEYAIPLAVLSSIILLQEKHFTDPV